MPILCDSKESLLIRSFKTLEIPAGNKGGRYRLVNKCYQQKKTASRSSLLYSILPLQI